MGFPHIHFPCAPDCLWLSYHSCLEAGQGKEKKQRFSKVTAAVVLIETTSVRYTPSSRCQRSLGEDKEWSLPSVSFYDIFLSTLMFWGQRLPGELISCLKHSKDSKQVGLSGWVQAQQANGNKTSWVISKPQDFSMLFSFGQVTPERGLWRLLGTT